MRNPFIENKAWSEGERDDCYSVSFGQSHETTSDLIDAIGDLLESRYAGRISSESSSEECQGFSIPLGGDPLLPAWTKILSFRGDETLLSGIFFAVFDLDALSDNERASIGRMVVVAQIKQGYSTEKKDIKMGKKEAKFFKQKIGKVCVPWNEDRALQDALTAEYEVQEIGKRLTTISKVLLGMLGAAATAALIKIIIDSGGEDELEEADEVLLGNLGEVNDLVLENNLDTVIPTIFEPLHDGIARFSASQIGRMIGMTGREVNLSLKEKGFLEGEPGNWHITEKGAPFAVIRYDDNGYGGSAGRSWEFPMWSEAIIEELGNPVEHLKQVNENRALAGLPLLDSLNPYRH